LQYSQLSSGLGISPFKTLYALSTNLTVLEKFVLTFLEAFTDDDEFFQAEYIEDSFRLMPKS